MLRERQVVRRLKHIPGKLISLARQFPAVAGQLLFVAKALKAPKFRFHANLNSKLWATKNRLRLEVKNKLIQIGKDFYEKLEVPEAKLQDILFTGSNANYNYGPTSDLDVHLLLHYSDVSPKEEFVREYMNDKKDAFNETYDLSIYGLPVEVYVQNVGEPLYAGGVYSLMQDKWINKPSHESPHHYDSKQITRKADDIVRRIDALKKLYQEGDYQEVVDKADKIKERIKKMRSSGLRTGGEFSVENLAFKALRNSGHLDKLYDIKVKAYDDLMSLRK